MSTYFFSQKNIDNSKHIKTIPIEEIDFKSIHVKKYIVLNKPNVVNKKIVYCFELPFGIVTFNSYVDIEKMRIVSTGLKINEYKLLCINTLSLSYFFKEIRNFKLFRVFLII